MTELTASKLAEILSVSKPTVIKAAKKELGLKPNSATGRYTFTYADVVQIIKIIRPNEFDAILQRKEIAETAERNTVNSGINSGNSENTVKSSVNTENQRLLEMLQRELENKENTIRAQQAQIDMLIKSNAMLTARLEDKAAAVDQQQPQQEQKVSWFSRLLRRGSR